jgi:hypothetical protein
MGKQIKVRFNLQGNLASGETMWAEQVGEDLYRILNIPFYAIGYAAGDIVRCITHNEWPEVVGMEHDSGNGTIRIYFANSESPEAQEVLNELVSVGCEYERASSKLVAVSIPPTMEVPFSQLSNYLNSTSDDIVIGWEVGKKPKHNPRP